jgi:hypothetical protein
MHVRTYTDVDLQHEWSGVYSEREGHDTWHIIPRRRRRESSGKGGDSDDGVEEMLERRSGEGVVRWEGKMR